MALQVDQKTTVETSTNKRIFASFDTTTEDTKYDASYKKPNFSGLDFEQVTVNGEKHYTSDIEQISIDNPRKMDVLTIDKKIEQHPERPIKVRLNARGKIIVSVLAICICALMAFMIGNAVTISALNTTLAQKQAMVASQQAEVDALQEQYDYIVSQGQETAAANGYSSSASGQEIDSIEELGRTTSQIETNWFDDLCNFLSNLFK